MSFCRITGRSKGLPKPNYFPLLPPISPVDAKRYCRITGKAYGLPSHHFIPVHLSAATQKINCRITNVADKLGPHHYAPDVNYGKRKHTILADYRYVYPIFDETNDTQKHLLDLMNTKIIDDGNFVYQVEERKYNLVFPAKLEAAVRDGDVRDVMLAKNSDTILLKMRQGKNVSVDLQDFPDEHCVNLFEGEGPRQDVLLEREREEKRKRKRQKNLSQMTKIFEEKDKSGDTKSTRKIKKIKTEEKNHNRSIFMLESKATTASLISSPECDDLVNPLLESWNWDTYEKVASSVINKKSPIVLPSPVKVTPIEIEPRDLSKLDLAVIENTSGFEAIACISPPPIFIPNPMDRNIVQHLRDLNEEDLEMTANVNEKLERVEGGIEMLPTESELPLVLENIKTGKSSQLANVKGLKLDINAARRVFLAGQNIPTPDGDVFVPGQTVTTPRGPVYVPGLTINTPLGASFIPGSILSGTKDSPNQPVFAAGQIIDDDFIPGQTIHTPNGPCFIEGQTILTPEGFKFLAGVHDPKTDQFICGQNISTPEGVRFVPGQTITTEDGEKFIAGQSVPSPNEDNGWKFIHGQTVNNEFLPGKVISSDEGSKFIPGLSVGDKFVPGITSCCDDELTFIPGINVETKQGPQFIEGTIIDTDNGQTFMPGKVLKSSEGLFDFAVAQSVHDVIFREPTQRGFVIDPLNFDASTPNVSVFGHMIQTPAGIEFYPEKVKEEHLPPGKIIPGRLIRQDEGTKFIPGIKSDNGFIPGQLIWTEKGEQFVPGQVIETSEGLKFVPGQVIETKSGSKFVPGQVMETSEGARFVPGQIVQTKSGPTFIPGQVITTDEEGERFVPGQVVDTPDGPRFVPGRVLETEDGATFIPGQIVETADGPKFIAPDLTDNEEGEQEFSVQSFLVTPEELKLVKSSNTFPTAPSERGELSIDSKIMRQLSEAGMSIGRQIEASAVDLVLQSTKEKQIVHQFVENLTLPEQLSEEKTTEMFGNIKSIAQIVSGRKILENITCRQAKFTDDDTVKAAECIVELVKKIVRDEDKSVMIFETIAQTLEAHEVDLLKIEKIARDPACQLKIISMIRDSLERDINECEILQKITQCANVEESWMMNQIGQILRDESMNDSLKAIVSTHPKIIYKIISHLRDSKHSITTNEAAIETLHRAIISAVEDVTNADLQRVYLTNEPSADQLVKDVISLAKALELPALDINTGSAIDTLSAFLATEQGAELLRRVILIHKLSDTNPNVAEALDELRQSPFSVRRNPQFCELVRQSGCLTIPYEKRQLLENSSQLPNAILFTDNQLALEDFLVRRRGKNRGAFLIVKNTFQGVVPRELSRDVLTGKCSYTLLDEDGICHFEPLHVFTALNLVTSRPQHRFSMYHSDVAMEDSGPGVDDIMSSASKCTALGAVASKMMMYRDQINCIPLLRNYRHYPYHLLPSPFYPPVSHVIASVRY
ncbi:uncharacterized protein LOC129800600 [Phlebotomus papatasi]|uniref:Uncharacterized protein n=1 Tax=Phlebotomus papatasi TaxID=29031 RepID=A0A1B0DPE6_PHLPP|nr:uncharacterized protein LOC129800600 [Phlebotomus papatasi]